MNSIVQGNGRVQVASPGILGLLEGSAHVGIAGQVINLCWLNLPKQFLDLSTVAQVETVQLHATGQMLGCRRPLAFPADAGHPHIGLIQQRLGQEPAGKSGHPGY